MNYLDTRSEQSVSFAEALIASLSSSGGLWVPQRIPQLALPQGDYCSIAAEVAAPWVGDWCSRAELEELFRSAWPGGEVPAPGLRQLEDNLWLLELFNGPSLAFKDYGLFFLGRCFERDLARRSQRGLALVATSGDTGSAAVAALSGLPSMDLVVLLPEGRISQVQQAQMTCGLADNVHALLVDGTFDDCQAMVKHCLPRRDLLTDDRLLLSVNSINFGRVLAQLCYYCYACAQLCGEQGAQRVSFAVPSGNFGNAYSAWLARSAGMPVDKMLVACNRNDYLHQVMAQGKLPPPQKATPTLAPAIDIGLPSGLERLLYASCDGDNRQVARWMSSGRRQAQALPQAVADRLAGPFISDACTDEDIVEQMRRAYDDYGVVCDPHTSLGLRMARRWLAQGGQGPAVAVATAHPCKFPQAVERAGLDRQPLPEGLEAKMHQPSRAERMAASPVALQQWVQEKFGR